MRGRIRQAYTRTGLFDGREITGLAELRDYLLNTRQQDFLEQVCRKLVSYATGCAYRLSDRPMVEAMTQRDLAVGNMVERVVLSCQFCKVRGKPEDQIR